MTDLIAQTLLATLFSAPLVGIVAVIIRELFTV